MEAEAADAKPEEPTGERSFDTRSDHLITQRTPYINFPLQSGHTCNEQTCYKPSNEEENTRQGKPAALEEKAQQGKGECLITDPGGAARGRAAVSKASSSESNEPQAPPCRRWAGALGLLRAGRQRQAAVELARSETLITGL